MGGATGGRPTLAQASEFLAPTSQNMQFGQVTSQGQLSSNTVFKAVALASWAADRGIYGLNLAKDTKAGSLLRGYGFFAWNNQADPITGVNTEMTAGLYGFEGDIRPIGMQYITQYNENPEVKTFNLQLSKETKKHIFQAFATVTDPQMFKNWWLHFEDPTSTAPALHSAINNYASVINNPANIGKNQPKNAATEAISNAFDNVLNAADTYNAWLNSGVMDLSLKMVPKDKAKPAFHIGGTSIVDENGNPAFRSSAYITTGPHLGIALVSDQKLVAPMSSSKLKGLGGGLTLVYPKWTVAGLVESTNKNNLTYAQAQTSILYTPSDEKGYMATFAAASHFWKAKFFTEGRTISTFISASKTEDVYNVGMKTLLAVNKANELYLFGGIGRDLRKNQGQLTRTNIELGLEQYPLMNSYNWAIGTRYDNLLGRNQWMFFFNLTKTF